MAFFDGKQSGILHATFQLVKTARKNFRNYKDLTENWKR